MEIFDGVAWQGIGAEKWRALLAVLLLNARQVMSVDRIAIELWGDSPPQAFRNVIHGYVARLRGVLDGGRRRILVTRQPGYQLLVDQDELDAGRFASLVERGRRTRGDAWLASARLTEALALWQGPALADVPRTPLVQIEAARLEEQRLTAVQLRVDADLVCGRHMSLIPELRALAGEHPFREPLWRQLMLAQYRSGRQAEALATYRSVKRRFVDEFGIDPGAELQRLELAILRRDPGLAVATPGSDSWERVS